ncbi:hypothetical protein BDB00DRAFT_845868 [Zychaea mexicana]|uniref:uncharacterized protein n=1 Tax=Zychaea mexicana TaxID=64656 RepID=UPI0022FE855C|nr:uncharacterized protein BDB00DRAFT_845868 [Zychaea mexicana]KAI9488941.1 hypothetical protein BDB00DRAFT_845868 [Zychaea mexicana]
MVLARDDNDEKQTLVKVAVIGSGLAGLTSAYLLSHNEHFEPHVFEKGEKLGMDAASISVGSREDDKFRVDVPMRSFMSGYYSHLFRLYQHLDISFIPAKFSFGWYRIQAPNINEPLCIATDQATYKTLNQSQLSYSGSRTIGSLESPESRATTFGEYIYDIYQTCWKLYVVSISYLWLMGMALWLHHRGHLRDREHIVSRMTLGDWFRRHHFHPYFVHDIFVPLFAAVCTNSWKSMLDYPAVDVLEYMAMGLFQESYVVSGGVRNIVQKLASPLQHIHLQTCIVSIKPSSVPGYKLELQDASGRIYQFHHVIFATQGNQALKILEQCRSQLLSAQEKACCTEADQTLYKDIGLASDILGQFRYDKSVVVNHTDTRLLPSDQKSWRSLNFASLDSSVQLSEKNDVTIPYPHDTTMTTHILTMTHDNHILKAKDNLIYMQTTNPCVSPLADKILSKAWFERATVTLTSKKAIFDGLFSPKDDRNTASLQLGRCQGNSGIWFVGSYCWPGIPLLEGCVASAEKVVTEGIAAVEGVPLQVPWKTAVTSNDA